MEIVKQETTFKLITTVTDTKGKTHTVDISDFIPDHLADDIFHEIDLLSDDESFLITVQEELNTNE